MKPLVFAALIAMSQSSLATLLVEDFEAPFPAWESAWLGTNSNVTNFYGVGAGRGNNPDGLWISDGDGALGTDTVEIRFDPIFAASLAFFSIDIAPHISGITIDILDINGVSILNAAVPQTSGATQDPGNYNTFFANSNNGILGFNLITTAGGQIEGNTGIDNVTVRTTDQRVPEPTSLALLGLGLIGIGHARRQTT